MSRHQFLDWRSSRRSSQAPKVRHFATSGTLLFLSSLKKLNIIPKYVLLLNNIKLVLHSPFEHTKYVAKVFRHTIGIITFFGVEIHVQSNKSVVVGVRNSGFEKMSAAHFSLNALVSASALLSSCVWGRASKEARRSSSAEKIHCVSIISQHIL